MAPSTCPTSSLWCNPCRTRTATRQITRAKSITGAKVGRLTGNPATLAKSQSSFSDDSKNARDSRPSWQPCKSCTKPTPLGTNESLFSFLAKSSPSNPLTSTDSTAKPISIEPWATRSTIGSTPTFRVKRRSMRLPVSTPPSSASVAPRKTFPIPL